MNHALDPERHGENDTDPDHPRGGAEDITVEVSDTQSHLTLSPAAINRLVRDVLAAEGVSHASISVAVVDDAGIRSVNRRYLDHDWPTDVISFPLSDPDEDVLSGELIVSAEMADVTARQAGVNPWDELALYMVHGLLHLCGHDDSNAKERDAMRRREDEILAQLGLSNTFSAVTAGGTVAAEASAELGGRERVRWTV